MLDLLASEPRIMRSRPSAVGTVIGVGFDDVVGALFSLACEPLELLFTVRTLSTQKAVCIRVERNSDLHDASL
jgi:hypothetical protein